MHEAPRLSKSLRVSVSTPQRCFACSASWWGAQSLEHLQCLLEIVELWEHLVGVAYVRTLAQGDILSRGMSRKKELGAAHSVKPHMDTLVTMSACTFRRRDV